MRHSAPVERVNAFFDSYRRAFEALDASVIADHFAYPCHMTSDAGNIVLTPIATREEWVPQIARLLETYRRIGFVSASVADLSSIELSPRLLHAVVHWELHDAAGAVLYDFSAMYTLAVVDEAFKITALAHDEIRRARLSTR